MPWYPHLLYYWRVPPSTCLWKVICTHLFLFMIIICGGLFFLWESFLFMRISSYLWSSVRIFSVYENLFLFMIICKNLFFLWELFWISSYLWSSVRICSYLYSIILLLIFYHTYPSFIIHLFILISKNWKSSWT